MHIDTHPIASLDISVFHALRHVLGGAADFRRMGEHDAAVSRASFPASVLRLAAPRRAAFGLVEEAGEPQRAHPLSSVVRFADLAEKYAGQTC